MERIINPHDSDPFSEESIKKNKMRYEVLKDIVYDKARKKHLNFIDFMWSNPSEKFTIGRHTRILCQKIDESLDRFARGRSTFLVMAVPFRHGKAFRVDTPILTVTGWRTHGSLRPGDFVFNDKGIPVMVEVVTPIHKNMISTIEFTHGELLYTTPGHLWPIWNKTRTGRHVYKGIKQTVKIGMTSSYRGEDKEVFIDRQSESNDLARINKGIVIPGNRAFIKEINHYYEKNLVNCIQVQGGIYLIGKGLIPTHNSEIISRKLPAHFLGLFPDNKVLLTGHTAALSVGYSKESRNLLLSEKYHELFPDTKLSQFDTAANHWKLANREGEMFAAGLGGSLAGQGYNLGIVDDYCKNRADAESLTWRDRMWSSFTNDFLTRRAPRSITVVTATPWHVDDVIGRIKKAMKSDPFFPKFEFVVIPAFSEEYEEGILFPERFSKSWYDEQRAALGEYGTSSLLQCDPVQQGGNILKVDNVKKVPLKDFPDIPYIRIWDLAHTEKQRNSPDPDYTSGTLLGMRRKPGAPRLWELWVKDIKRFRHDATKRDNTILQITASDGPYIKIGMENTIDSKDAFKHLSTLLLGQRIITSIQIKGDKVVRASPLEPIFEDGSIYVPEGASWFQSWIDELSSFPNGSHDDQVDNLSAGFVYFNKGSGAISVNLYET
jgi:predicted phage terminase large subunit-like protein